MTDPVITSNVPPEPTPVVPPTAFGSFKDAFAAKFEGMPDSLTEDELVQSIEHAISRTSLLQDNEDENTLRSYREAAAWRQQNASDFEKFQEWKAKQAPAPEPEAPKPDAWQPRYKPVNVDPGLLQYLERDNDTGLFRAKYPELAPRAEEANKMLQYRQRLADEMYNDPYQFGQEIARPLLEQYKTDLQRQLDELKSQLQPLQKHTELSALEAFERQNASLLMTTKDGQAAWTPAGEAYDSFMAEDGLSPQQALKAVQRLIEKGIIPTSGSPEPEVPKTPESVKKTFTARAKAVTRATGQPTDASNTVTTAIVNHDTQQRARMTSKGRWKASAAEAEREILEGQAT